jgi:hypothetical protein
MKFYLFIILLSTVLYSCSTFQNPQPFDGVRITAIPSEWIGQYKCLQDSCVLKMSIESTKVELTSQSEVAEPVSAYFENQGKHYVREAALYEYADEGYKKNDSTEVFFPKWENDSIKALSKEVQTMIFGQELILRRSGPIYIANVRQIDIEKKKKIDKPLWVPIVILPKGEFLEFYYIDEKKFERLERNKQGIITEDLSSSDFSELVRKKRKSLISFGFQLNVQDKKMILLPEK